MRLNGLFRDNMVFQRDKETRVFGETSYGTGTIVRAVFYDEAKKVILSGETSEVSEDGFFMIIMPAMKAGGPYTLKVSAENEVREQEDIFFDRYHSDITLKNVWFGEVWVAGGQNNMQYSLIRSEGARYVVPACPETRIHFYEVPVFGTYDEKQRIEEDKSFWSVIDKNTCGQMSAVAFYFARMLEDYLAEHAEDAKDLHFGIIGCYVGGCPISSWMSVETLSSTPEGRKYIDEYYQENADLSVDLMEHTLRQYNSAWKGYLDKCREILVQNPYTTYADMDRLIGPAPWPPPASPISINRPGALFDSMILRLIPFSLRGVIFYHGEDDCNEHAADYSVLFRSMIYEWRAAFWDDDLPFVFCQLPMYISKERKFMGYDDLRWPKLRDQQQIIANTVPGAYMAVLADCGEFDNIHPVDKKTPGERLAKMALKFIYGFEDISAVAPYVIDARRGEGVEVSFAGDFNSLKLVSEVSVDESGFEISNDEGEFYPAQAAVDFDGRTVLLSCPDVEFPSTVRYAYFSYGKANLVTDTGLAVAPFETKIDRAIGEFF